MKNPLHRKKLQLAIKTLGNGQPEKSSELDYIWVTRTQRQQKAHAEMTSEVALHSNCASVFHRVAR